MCLLMDETVSGRSKASKHHDSVAILCARRWEPRQPIPPSRFPSGRVGEALWLACEACCCGCVPQGGDGRCLRLVLRRLFRIRNMEAEPVLSSP